MAQKVLKHDSEIVWAQFVKQHDLTPIQEQQFKQYYQMLKETNDLHNLTAITDLKGVVNYHFNDSLALDLAVNCNELTCLADVGTGGGFPAVPLKIKYPHLKIILIEVTHKKIEFLESVIQKLHLTNVEISGYDWRTFLRKTEYPIELFCARASLPPDELIRVFKPSCIYKNAQLVYWASKYWQETPKAKPFMAKEAEYTVGSKRRQLIFFARTLTDIL